MDRVTYKKSRIAALILGIGLFSIILIGMVIGIVYQAIICQPVVDNVHIDYNSDCRNKSYIVSGIFIANHKTLTMKDCIKDIDAIINVDTDHVISSHCTQFNITNQPFQYILNRVDEIYQMIDQLILSGKRILITSRNGNSRPPLVTIIYLMKKHHLSFKESLHLLKKQRKSVWINFGFLQQLAVLEKYSDLLELIDPTDLWPLTENKIYNC